MELGCERLKFRASELWCVEESGYRFEIARCESERRGRIRISPHGWPNSCEYIEEKDMVKGA